MRVLQCGTGCNPWLLTQAGAHQGAALVAVQSSRCSLPLNTASRVVIKTCCEPITGILLKGHLQGPEIQRVCQNNRVRTTSSAQPGRLQALLACHCYVLIIAGYCYRLSLMGMPLF